MFVQTELVEGLELRSVRATLRPEFSLHPPFTSHSSLVLRKARDELHQRRHALLGVHRPQASLGRADVDVISIPAQVPSSGCVSGLGSGL
ncbi:hypothetical protein [Paucibacter sp. Y2R2-4]|uniref:hypothetical protein n=1 Tax=Paucibacter sp. Y2R2-4 TaxID=2893553 RepID=UPI0021E50EC1|nr:hypothetical protein [Paucibacter sp. Y2R2-4]MCV2350667.1 hypothetical protein [Paucibacter sp. Y2R2-4]